LRLCLVQTQQGHTEQGHTAQSVRMSSCAMRAFPHVVPVALLFALASCLCVLDVVCSVLGSSEAFSLLLITFCTVYILSQPLIKLKYTVARPCKQQLRQHALRWVPSSVPCCVGQLAALCSV
jgi:hypothetical protein